MEVTDEQSAAHQAQRAKLCLRGIIATLWPDDEPLADWTPQTVDRIAALVDTWGFGPTGGAP